MFSFMLPLFSQTEKYFQLLNEAKKFESAQEYVFALGFYYDAMDECPPYANEAYENYHRILMLIKAGKPGKEVNNPFALYDGWLALLRNAEKYFTNYPPMYVQFGSFKQEKLDYATRTASYSTPITLSYTPKFIDIVTNGILDGLKIAYRSDWTDAPTAWPLKSTYSNLRLNNNYLQDGCALFEDDSKLSNAWIYFNRTRVSTSGSESANYSLYDLKFSVVDENGKELLSSGRHLINQKSYTFSDVPIAVMDLIESGKVFIKPNALYLEYGRYDNSDDIAGRAFIKKLPEMQIPLENVVWRLSPDMPKMISAFAKTVVHQKKNEMIFVKGGNFTFEHTIDLSDFYMNNKFIQRDITLSDFYMSKYEVTQAEWLVTMGENPSSFKTGAVEGEIQELRPVEEISFCDVLIYCNRRSVAEGLEPCYLLNNSKENMTNARTGKNRDEWKTIECDWTANGYRLPTEMEWLYVASEGGNSSAQFARDSNDIYEVTWLGENSNDKTHEVGLKKSNALGFFDMYGNVTDLCWDAYYTDFEFENSTNPHGEEDVKGDFDVERVSRGGSYSKFSDITSRSRASDDFQAVGFRVVRNAPISQ